jgi:hypothetical protein
MRHAANVPHVSYQLHSKGQSMFRITDESNRYSDAFALHKLNAHGQWLVVEVCQTRYEAELTKQRREDNAKIVAACLAERE